MIKTILLDNLRHRWLLGLLLLISALAVACGASAPVAPEPAATSAPAPAQPAATSPPVASGPTPTPFATVRTTFTPVPVEAIAAKDTIILVTSEEPNDLGPRSQGCQGNVPIMICEEVASDPITWIDSNTFQVVPLSGIEGWEQTAPNIWRFRVRRGVEFHNGEPMNAEALKLGIDLTGDMTHDGAASFHGATHGEIIDEFTVDAVCDKPCPIYPRQAIFDNVQAPKWWVAATEDEKPRTTVGVGVPGSR